MGFWNRIFRRKKKPEVQEDWESIVYDRDTVDFREKEQRDRYISGCLEQIAEASKEISLLTGEYSLVTSYLTDMEEIEALPEEERETLNDIARRLLNLEQECEKYRDKKNRMNDSRYYRMRKQEEEIQEGIRKLSECEKYGGLVKQDMQRLDRERHAYDFRRMELETMMNNLRGMALIFLTALGVCVAMLMVLQFGFEMNTQVGYILSAAAAAVAITVMWVRYTDSEKEKHKVDAAVNKLIQLQNKVKIRYVNNRNLMDYLYIKYNTNSAASLEKQWQEYLQEKEERKEYAEAEARIGYYQKLLLGRMANYRIAAPDRWTRQAGALLDKREMVEMRHELILRRQALRKQMDYNNEVAEAARREIRDITQKYPAYAGEISYMVDRFQAEKQAGI